MIDIDTLLKTDEDVSQWKKSIRSGMKLTSLKTTYKLLAIGVAFLCNFVGTAMAYEEPSYELINSNAVYEIRKYSDRLAVKTIHSSGENGAFRRLFNYISGANQSSFKIAMTIPVMQSNDDNGMAMHFFLPSNYTKETAPVPKAENVSLVTFTGGYYAVIKYSGRSTDANFRNHAQMLNEALYKDGIHTLRRPIKATYNGPLTPFFLRRNEAMYQVEWK